MATYDYRDPFATSTLNRTLMSAVDKLYNLIGCLMEVINNQNLKLASKNKENLDFIEEQRLKNILLFLLSNTNSQYFTDFEGLSKLLTFDIFDDNERIILFVHFITRSNAKMNDIQRTLTIKLRQYNRDMQKLNRDPYFNTEDKKAGGQLLTLLRLFHFFSYYPNLDDDLLVHLKGTLKLLKVDDGIIDLLIGYIRRRCVEFINYSVSLKNSQPLNRICKKLQKYCEQNQSESSYDIALLLYIILHNQISMISYRVFIRDFSILNKVFDLPNLPISDKDKRFIIEQLININHFVSSFTNLAIPNICDSFNPSELIQRESLDIDESIIQKKMASFYQKHIDFKLLVVMINSGDQPNNEQLLDLFKAEGSPFQYFWDYKNGSISIMNLLSYMGLDQKYMGLYIPEDEKVIPEEETMSLKDAKALLFKFGITNPNATRKTFSAVELKQIVFAMGVVNSASIDNFKRVQYDGAVRAFTSVTSAAELKRVLADYKPVFDEYYALIGNENKEASLYEGFLSMINDETQTTECEQLVAKFCNLLLAALKAIGKDMFFDLISLQKLQPVEKKHKSKKKK